MMYYLLARICNPCLPCIVRHGLQIRASKGVRYLDVVK